MRALRQAGPPLARVAVWSVTVSVPLRLCLLSERKQVQPPSITVPLGLQCRSSLQVPQYRPTVEWNEFPWSTSMKLLLLLDLFVVVPRRYALLTNF